MDDIYRNTSWDEEFSGYGVQIQQVRSRFNLPAPFPVCLFKIKPSSSSSSSSSSVRCQIIIEKSPTPVAPGKSHFNMRGSPVEDRDVWDVKKLLEVALDEMLTC